MDILRLQSSVRYKGWFLFFGMLPVLSAAALSWYLEWSGKTTVFLWSCPLFERFGIACPGCGATRAVCALLRLEFSRAVRMNLAVALLAFVVACAYIYHIIRILWFDRFAHIDSRILAGVLCYLLLFTVLRNCAFYPFPLPG